EGVRRGGARPLGDREPAALGAGRGVPRGCESGAEGPCSGESRAGAADRAVAAQAGAEQEEGRRRLQAEAGRLERRLPRGGTPGPAGVMVFLYPKMRLPWASTRG